MSGALRQDTAPRQTIATMRWVLTTALVVPSRVAGSELVSSASRGSSPARSSLSRHSWSQALRRRAASATPGVLSVHGRPRGRTRIGGERGGRQGRGGDLPGAASQASPAGVACCLPSFTCDTRPCVSQAGALRISRSYGAARSACLALHGLVGQAVQVAAVREDAVASVPGELACDAKGDEQIHG